MTHLLGRALATLVAVALVPAWLPAPAAAQPPEADYSSFFAGDALEGAAWRACAAGGTARVGPRTTGAAARTRAGARQRRDLEVWSLHSGIPVRFAGRERLTYDNTSYLLRASGEGPTPARHIYIGFYGAREVAGLSGNVVGLARPTSVLTSEREVVSGMAVFRRGYVLREQKAEPRHLTHLYLHELGHVFGLGHASSEVNVMYPSLGTLTDLGPGDRAGAATFTHPCPVTSTM